MVRVALRQGNAQKFFTAPAADAGSGGERMEVHERCVTLLALVHAEGGIFVWDVERSVPGDYAPDACRYVAPRASSRSIVRLPEG